MHILVTGGLGNLGGRLVDSLSNDGFQITISTRKSKADCPSWAQKFNICQVDPSNKKDWQKALIDIDFIFHLASPDAESAFTNPNTALKSSVEMTWVLLEALSDLDEKIPLINLSTFHIYGSNARNRIFEETRPAPNHPYAISHLFSETIVHRFCEKTGIKALNARLSNSFGAPLTYEAAKWSLVFNDLCLQAIVSKKLVLKTSGRQKRNFITIEDTVEALKFLLKNQENWPPNNIIHIGSELQWSILEVAELISERSRTLWSYKPELLVSVNDGIDHSEFIFDVSVLKNMGFIWQNSINEEIDNTLKICAAWNKKQTLRSSQS